MDGEDFPAIESEYLGPHNAVFHNYHPHFAGRYTEGFY